MSESADVCIIGSGFGGAITAVRLAERAAALGRPLSIRVLERGHDYFDFDPQTRLKYRNAQGNGFKQSLDPAYYSQLVNIYTDEIGVESLAPDKGPSFTVLAGNGIGGSSLVYLAIKLRAPTETFEQTDDGGRRLWPSALTRAALNPYYARVEQALKVVRLRWQGQPGDSDLCTRRDRVFAEGCLKIGASSEPLKIALQGGRDEGWWSTGNRFGGKQHLPINYLARARALGVRFDANCEVSRVSPDGRGYVVHYRDARSGSDVELGCRIAVVAGGAVGSTGILLRSRVGFTGAREFGDHLGQHISGNGDYGMVGVVGPQHRVDSHRGKQMASFCPTFWKSDRFVLVPFFAPAYPMAFGNPAELALPENPAALGRRSTRPVAGRLWGKGYLDALAGFGPRVLTVAILSWDRCEGVASIGAFGKISLQWKTTHPETERIWSAGVARTRAIFNALGGELYTDTYRHRGHVISAHPLGGCRMAESRADGVTDPFGEVFGNPNLFVIDAAIVPTALGVHPSLTVAAVSERAADKLAETLESRLAT